MEGKNETTVFDDIFDRKKEATLTIYGPDTSEGKNVVLTKIFSNIVYCGSYLRKLRLSTYSSAVNYVVEYGEKLSDSSLNGLIPQVDDFIVSESSENLFDTFSSDIPNTEKLDILFSKVDMFKKQIIKNIEKLNEREIKDIKKALIEKGYRGKIVVKLQPDGDRGLLVRQGSEVSTDRGPVSPVDSPKISPNFEVNDIVYYNDKNNSGLYEVVNVKKPKVIRSRVNLLERLNDGLQVTVNNKNCSLILSLRKNMCSDLVPGSEFNFTALATPSATPSATPPATPLATPSNTPLATRSNSEPLEIKLDSSKQCTYLSIMGTELSRILIKAFNSGMTISSFKLVLDTIHKAFFHDSLEIYSFFFKKLKSIEELQLTDGSTAIDYLKKEAMEIKEKHKAISTIIINLKGNIGEQLGQQLGEQLGEQIGKYVNDPIFLFLAELTEIIEKAIGSLESNIKPLSDLDADVKSIIKLQSDKEELLTQFSNYVESFSKLQTLKERLKDNAKKMEPLMDKIKEVEEEISDLKTQNQQQKDNLVIIKKNKKKRKQNIKFLEAEIEKNEKDLKLKEEQLFLSQSILEDLQTKDIVPINTEIAKYDSLIQKAIEKIDTILHLKEMGKSIDYLLKQEVLDKLEEIIRKEGEEKYTSIVDILNNPDDGVIEKYHKLFDLDSYDISEDVLSTLKKINIEVIQGKIESYTIKLFETNETLTETDTMRQGHLNMNDDIKSQITEEIKMLSQKNATQLSKLEREYSSMGSLLNELEQELKKVPDSKIDLSFIYGLFDSHLSILCSTEQEGETITGTVPLVEYLKSLQVYKDSIEVEGGAVNKKRTRRKQSRYTRKKVQKRTRRKYVRKTKHDRIRKTKRKNNTKSTYNVKRTKRNTKRKPRKSKRKPRKEKFTKKKV